MTLGFLLASLVTIFLLLCCTTLTHQMMGCQIHFLSHSGTINNLFLLCIMISCFSNWGATSGLRFPLGRDPWAAPCWRRGGARRSWPACPSTSRCPSSAACYLPTAAGARRRCGGAEKDAEEEGQGCLAEWRSSARPSRRTGAFLSQRHGAEGGDRPRGTSQTASRRSVVNKKQTEEIWFMCTTN